MGPNKPEAKKPEIHDNTSVPLRWLVAICCVIITAVAVMAKDDVSGIRGEIKAMRENIVSLNTSVTTLLADRDNTKENIKKIEAEVSEHRKMLWDLQKKPNPR